MKTDTKQIITLAVSFVIGLLAFCLTHIYLKNERAKIDAEIENIRAGTEQVKVLVAVRALPTGTVIQPGDVAKKSVPRSGMSGEPVVPEDFDRIVGMKLLSPLEKEQPLLWVLIDTPYRPGTGLSPMINREMRAVSIAVGGPSAVSGLVQPNDRIDVLGTFSMPSKTPGEMETVTMTILQNVTVLATGTQLAKAPRGADRTRRTDTTGYGMVTLEVSPAEAELLVFAGYMKGKLTLTLRNPTDIDYLKETQTVDFSHLQKKIPEYNERRQSTLIRRRR